MATQVESKVLVQSAEAVCIALALNLSVDSLESCVCASNIVCVVLGVVQPMICGDVAQSVVCSRVLGVRRQPLLIPFFGYGAQ